MTKPPRGSRKLQRQRERAQWRRSGMAPDNRRYRFTEALALTDNPSVKTDPK